ncbi:PAS domain-containing hybrid sensor histidine kinase/response regulator [Phaeobacter sp. B1627]|uniref:PAS domain-containing hybrid sensor histidine kinase/response regulator n=1 Tax=Phaeobacter sp. B1627 TaxID=2583809 RepID=UPI00159EF38B|nr:ATP-binding protein [Phaeobacter sp. B1627]
MIILFLAHVLLFSVFAMGLTLMLRPYRAIYFYAYLSIILIVGGFLGNAYSLPLSEGIVVSGGNLAYGAFMMTSILFVLAERDVFILRRLVQLVVGVDVFNILLSAIITGTLNFQGVVNPHGTPPALFATSIPFIILGGVLIILELGVMLFLFEAFKRFIHSKVAMQIAYLLTFIAILCADGVLFPMIAFGTAPEIITIIVGSLPGKILTAAAYGLAVVAFTVAFPKRFSSYLETRVFTWRTLLLSSSQILRDLEDKENQLTKSQSRIVHSAELAGLGYAISDSKTGRVVECDEVYAAMHGLSVKDFDRLETSRLIEQLIHEEDREKALEIRQKVQNGEAAISELRHVLPNGEVRSLRKIFTPLASSGSDSHLYEVVGQDVTDSRRLQDQLYQSQKMDAIGKLTGGIAHDFNNLLAVTLGNLELLNDEIADPEKKALIQNSIQSTLRGADLTRNMLSFARKAPLQPRIVDINQVVGDLEKWTSRTLPSTIAVKIKLGDRLSAIKADPSSAESGLLNLILNARDAMPEGGTLTIETSQVTVSPDRADPGDDDLEPGQYVRLSVSDTGEGISQKNLKRIFEPFFTTKPVGSGSGLGLSMLDGFMRQSGGTIRAVSEEGKGTTFHLYFPAAMEDQAADPAAAEPAADPVKKGPATILVVEDNADVLNALQMTLEKSGFRVVKALSGDDALKTYHAEPNIDLLLTDIVMPGTLQGPSLADAIRALRPELPIIFMSGNLSEASDADAPGRSQDARLMKPVKREDLLQAVRAALAATD